MRDIKNSARSNSAKLNSDPMTVTDRDGQKYTDIQKFVVCRIVWTKSISKLTKGQIY